MYSVAIDLLRKIHSEAGRWDEALAANLEALAIMERFVDDPTKTDDTYFVFLRRTITLVGCYDKLNRGHEAVPHLRAAAMKPMPSFRKGTYPKEALLLCAQYFERATPSPDDAAVVDRAREMLAATADQDSFQGIRDRLHKALADRGL